MSNDLFGDTVNLSSRAVLRAAVATFDLFCLEVAPRVCPVRRDQVAGPGVLAFVARVFVYFGLT